MNKTTSLAKELKEACLLQRPWANRDVYFRGVLTPFESVRKSYYDNGNTIAYNVECVQIPTLEELIMACGERFDSLQRDIEVNLNTKEEKVIWYCTPDKGLSEMGVPGVISKFVGYSPEEAVAYLYIMLHKTGDNPVN